MRRRHVAMRIWSIWSLEQGTRYSTRRRPAESAAPSTSQAHPFPLCEPPRDISTDGDPLDVDPDLDDWGYGDD